MPMYGERLAAAMSCAVPVPIAGAMLAVITAAVTMVIRWRAALPCRRVPQPDGVGTSLTTAPASTHWATDADSTLLRRWLVDSHAQYRREVDDIVDGLKKAGIPGTGEVTAQGTAISHTDAKSNEAAQSAHGRSAKWRPVSLRSAHWRIAKATVRPIGYLP